VFGLPIQARLERAADLHVVAPDPDHGEGEGDGTARNQQRPEPDVRVVQPDFYSDAPASPVCGWSAADLAAA
jgi:hypothetical protein